MFKVNPDKVYSLEDLEEQRARVLSILLDSIKQVRETELGYCLKLGGSGEDLVLASEWMQLERLSNPFLRFSLMSESHAGPISLEIAGPTGTKDFLSAELVLSRWL